MGRGLIALLALVLMATTPAAGSPAVPDLQMTGLKTRIQTPRYEPTVAFYRDLLGLKVLDSWDNEGDRGTILGLGASARGQAFLEIGYAGEELATGAVSLQFRVADIEAVVDRLRGRWKYRGPEERPWGSTYLYLHDPAGTRVIIYEGEL